MELKTNLSFFSLLEDTTTFMRNRLKQFLIFSVVYTLFAILMSYFVTSTLFNFDAISFQPNQVNGSFFVVIFLMVSIQMAAFCAGISNFNLGQKFDSKFFIEKFFSNFIKILLTFLAMIVITIMASIIISILSLVLNLILNKQLTLFLMALIFIVLFIFLSIFIIYFCTTLIDPNQQKSWFEQMSISFKLVFKNKLITIIALISYFVILALSLYLYKIATTSIFSFIVMTVLGIIFSIYSCILQIFLVSFFYRIYFLSVNQNEQFTPQQNDNQNGNNGLIV